MRERLLPAAILGAGMILAAGAFGVFFWLSRVPAQSISTVGSATTRVQSDVVKWRFSLARRVEPDGVKAGLVAITADRETLLQLLRENGLDTQDLTFLPARTEEIYAPDGGRGPVGYWVVLGGFLPSRDIDGVLEVALNPSLLADAGLELRGSDLEYFVSDLGELKRQLLAEATADAKRRAEQIAASTGNRVTAIRSARQGVFQITEPYSTAVSDYGIYSTQTREKDVTVTVRAEFAVQ